ncbi:MAG: A/G-specific adenine glycosylase [Desulfobacteraceae bacterium]|nr:MAG: A/G-specific adenine glycosylase [Desulfobacteraceae bacterium]
MQKQIKTEISKKLLTWYDRHQRDLPWRHSVDPYRIWVSEIMLQQTQVDTVIPYYNRFIKKFPRVERLARAPLDEVLKLWENLGYYSRARYLHAAAIKIVQDYNSCLPGTYEGLLSLPGIGPYTAGAILSMAFNKPIPAVDGNVIRVISRLFCLNKPLPVVALKKKIQTIIIEWLLHTRPGHFNQALMDLGAGICVPVNPDCRKCPLNGICKARKRNIQDQLPIKAKRADIPHKDFMAGIIRKKDCVLLVKRPAKGLLGGLWKFPGNESEDKDSLPASLKRSIHQELGISVTVGQKLMSVDHRYTHFQVTLHAFQCNRLKGRPRALGCAEWLWVPPDRLPEFAFSKADRQVMRFILTDDQGAD